MKRRFPAEQGYFGTPCARHQFTMPENCSSPILMPEEKKSAGRKQYVHRRLH